MKNPIPVYGNYDVVVCGGGTAGAFAAIAAADQGMSVLVIEQFGSLGGTATNGLVTPVMHTHINGNPQCSYIFDRLVARQKKYGGCNDAGNMFDPLVLEVALEELCVESGAKLLYHTFVSDAVVENGAVTAVKIVNKGGEKLVTGKVFIDCTGDGDVSVLAGAGYTKGNPETGVCQPMSLRYLLGGVDIRKVGEFFESETARTGAKGASYDRREESVYAAVTANGEWALTDCFRRAIAAGDLEPEDEMYWQVFMIPGRADGLAFNCPEFFDHIDGTNPDDLTYSQIRGKKAILRQLAFYKKYMKGFENAYVAEIASMVGIRESRNIDCEYVLTARDLLSQRKFGDCVCQSNYPIDIHGKSLHFSLDGIEKDESRPWYDIPYRSLVVAGIDNLLVAGRCLGAEFLVQSSLRVQHSCRATGEACGIAAALAVRGGVPSREIDGAEVRKIMVDKGAVFAE